MKIRSKLILSISSIIVVVVLLMMILTFFATKKIVVYEVNKDAFTILEANVAKMDGKLQIIEQVAISIAGALENIQVNSEDEIINLIKNFVHNTPEAFGSAVAFEPFSFDKSRIHLSPYCYKSKNEILCKDLSYDYFKWNWYKIPAETKKPLWSEPYFDKGGGDIDMVTFSYPFFKDGKVWGVATVDISLHELTTIVDKIRIARTGKAALLSPSGKIIAHSFKDLHKNLETDELVEKFNTSIIDELTKKIISDKSGMMSYLNPKNDKKTIIAFEKIPTTKWSLVLGFPYDELMEDLHTLTKKLAAVAGIGIFMIIAIIYLISSRISRPIAYLANIAKKIAEGEFRDIPDKLTKTNDEIKVLAVSFREMMKSLKKTLGDLKNEKGLLQTSFSHMKDGVILFDKDFNILQKNQMAERVLLLSSKTPDFVEHIEAQFEAIPSLIKLTRDLKDKSSFKLSRRDAETLGKLHLDLTIAPILDDSKTVIQYLANLRDITIEEEENFARRNFLSLISHKLFTPLTVLEGKVSLVKDGLLGSLSEKQQKVVNDMAIQIIKLKELIESLVSFVSLESSGIDRSREEIELRPFMEKIIAEKTGWFSDKTPDVKLDLSKDAMKLNFNKKYLSLIVSHLLENALKFNLSAPATVSIRCSLEGNSFTMIVKDNGIGIPPEHLDKIFDLFYQIDKYFTGNIEGVGLGLPYIKKISKEFNGDISVSSTPGKGSIFTVHLKV